MGRVAFRRARFPVVRRAGIGYNYGVKRDWYVLHVKPRTEKKAAAYLRRWGYFHYLPCWVKETRIQRRRVRTELPLFPGYVFARLSPDERREMLRTSLLVQTIRATDPRLLVHQLRQIARAARGGAAFQTANPFKAGDCVRVKYGPFRGVEGYVERGSTAIRLILNVEILGTAVALRISPGDVEKA